MIELNVEGYCHQCLDFTSDVIPPIRGVNDKGEHVQTNTIVQCKYKKRCEGIRRYLIQQAKDEAVG